MSTITITDPRHVDGDPHEVAAHAGLQLGNLLEAAYEGVENLRWAARNAWMTAEEHRTGVTPKSTEFDDTVQGERLDRLFRDLQAVRAEAALLTVAASYNPRAPVGKHD